MRFYVLFFFFNDTATTEIYTLSLHDALPIFTYLAPKATIEGKGTFENVRFEARPDEWDRLELWKWAQNPRSEEHTSELQSRQYLVCRLLLEKKKQNITPLKFNTPINTYHIFS